MLGPSHRLFAAASATAYAVWVDGLLDPVVVGLSAVVATASAAGWSSPDVDQTRPWEALARALGPAGKLLAHRRGITHWWALPVVAWWLWLPSLAPEAGWAARALLLGWASHIVGDALFGRVPVTPGWGPMFGLGLRTGGWVERGFRLPVVGQVSPLRTVCVAALLWAGVTLVA